MKLFLNMPKGLEIRSLCIFTLYICNTTPSLTLYYTTPSFKDFKGERFGKHSWKTVNFLRFPKCFQLTITNTGVIILPTFNFSFICMEMFFFCSNPNFFQTVKV